MLDYFGLDKTFLLNYFVLLEVFLDISDYYNFWNVSDDSYQIRISFSEVGNQGQTLVKWNSFLNWRCVKLILTLINSNKHTHYAKQCFLFSLYSDPW